MLTQDGGRTMNTLLGITGLCLVCRSAQQWRMSIIFCLIALCVAPSELVMPVSFRVPVQYQTCLPVVTQMHMVVS